MEILGMKEAVEIANQRIGSNMVISAQLVVEMAEQASHADALAEALDLLIQECGKVYSNSPALGDAELKAKIALANYRGEL